MTGTVSDVHIEFDISGTSLNTGYTFFLLTDADANFASGATAIEATSANASTVTFDDVTLTDGQYFTLASSALGPGGVSSNLHLWLKADAEAYSDAGTTLATDGVEVDEWHDQEGGTVLDAKTPGNGPDWDADAINFNPALDFLDSESDYLSITNGIFETTTKNDIFVYMVATVDETSSNHVGFHEDLASSTEFTGYLDWGVDWMIFDYGNTTNDQGRIQDATAKTTSEPYIWTFASSTSTATPYGTKKYMYRNNTVYDSGDPSTSNTGGAGVDDDFFIGCQGATVNHLEGYIAEFIVYDGIPTETEEDQIQSYLAVKYGITLAGEDYTDSDGSTVIWDYSANSAYHYDIAGIGADVLSGLDQRQSKSINSDAIVTMSTEAIGSTNAGISTALTDGTYLLWGNNNATSSAHDDLPVNYTGRLDKEWKVEMTGTVADVHVEFDISSEKLAGDAAADFYLLTDADGDFTSGATATVANSFSSNKVTFNDIDFTDGQYFTLATIQPGPGGVANGLLLWMKADDQAHNTGTTLATDGQTVDNWHDQSTHDFDADDSGTTGPIWDEDGCNFNPVLDFDGNTLDIPNGIMEGGTKTEMYTYCVVATDAAQISCVYYQQLNVAHVHWCNSFISNYNTGYAHYQHGLNTQEVANTSGITLGQYHLFSAKSDGADMQIWRDGNSIATDTDNGTATEVTNYPFYIGGNYVNNGAYDLDGKIAELIILDHTPTDNETDQIESYLAMKYGITMANTITMVDEMEVRFTLTMPLMMKVS